MPSVVVSDFKYGLDRRRPRAAAPPGTLWTLTNALISRGGDLERSKKWVPAYTLPAGTFGLSNINGQLTVFGSADLAGSMPVGVQYQRLTDFSSNMTRVLKVTVFAGQYYVIAEYSDGNIRHWYNAVQMTAWDALSDSNSSMNTLTTYMANKIDGNLDVHATASGPTILITADVPGTPFTVAPNAPAPITLTVTTLQANVVQVNEVRSSGTIAITSGVTGTLTDLTISGVHLITTPVPFLTDLDVTANAVTVEINNNTSTSTYQAIVVDNVITILAATGTGATPNGRTIVPTVSGAFGVTVTPFSGGVTAVAPVAQVVRVTFGGTYNSTVQCVIGVTATAAINYIATGRASGYGTDAFTYKQRIYFPAGNLLRYCALSDPTVMTGGLPASGPGFISVANDSEGNDPMLCLAPYQIYVALFSRRSIRIYDLQSDATLTNFRNPLQNTGTFAPHSVMAYGNTDVFYFDDTGIRSIQSRDVINTPYVGDVGSPIDTLVHDWYTTVGETISSRAASAIEPLDGRFMIAVGTNIFTLSYFPNSKVTAWSIQQPGFIATDFTASKRQLYARSTVAIAPPPPPPSGPIVIFLTSGTTWTVPSDWNNANNSIEAIGGGGAGRTAIAGGASGGPGGGGGAYAIATNVTLTPGASISYSIGQGGIAGAIGGGGGDTTFNVSTVIARGSSDTHGSGGGTGGQSVSCIPLIGSHSGGTGGGGTFNSLGGAGGGAAGGPTGVGKGANNTTAFTGGGGGGGGGADGGSSTVGYTNSSGGYGGPGGAASDGTLGGAAGIGGATPTAGGNGSHGSGGGGGGGTNGSAVAAKNGGNGSNAVVWTQTSDSSTAGPGSGAGGPGGGAGATAVGIAGTAGNYGGGGAGGAATTSVSGTGSNGANGIIVITYTPTVVSGGGGGGGTDTIYLYGGLSGTTYADAHELTTTIETSFVSAQSPDKVKAWTEFSAACQNVWDIYLLVDPDDDTKTIHIGKVHGNTYDLTTIAAVGEFPYVAVRAICTAAGNASLSNMTLGYAVDEE